MNRSDAPFYITGGTLQTGAPSYIERQADTDLYDALSNGEFCYILTSRQMGKSSLMVHTAARLRKEGVRVAILDLQGVGQNLTPEQWYGGLLRRLGRQLDPTGQLEEKLDEFWFDAERLGPLDRWMEALQRFVLPRVADERRTTNDEQRTTNDQQSEGAALVVRRSSLVIFVDEIDLVQTLPFSADEFFVAIRECYTRRALDPQFQRLTFCLLGVATPSDLIQDTRTTPFNIGRRIDLADFSEAEAAPLAKGLAREEEHGKAVLQRVLYWTGGHPQLTQRLCQAVAEDESVPLPATVDQHADALFLSASAREKDDNLLFVRDRLLRSGADLASLLDLYGQVRAGKAVRPDDTNPLIDLLRLSGIARLSGSRLAVRNRIYERVFDREWVTQHMPDAELRRQRAAYRRGLLRATAVSGVIAAVIAGLAGGAIRNAVEALEQKEIADRNLRIANVRSHRLQEKQRTLRRHLYVAQMNVAQQAWNDGNVDQTLALLSAQRPQPGEEDLRGFEWRYLWRLTQRHDDLFTFSGPTGDVGGAAAFSPDGNTVAMASPNGTVELRDRASGRQTGTLTRLNGPERRIEFSQDGKTLITVSESSSGSTVQLWDVLKRGELTSVTWRKGSVWPSGDGKTLAINFGNNTVKVWDVAARRELASLTGTDWSGAQALSLDRKTFAAATRDGRVELWDVTTKREVANLKGHTSFIGAMGFSPVD